MSIQSGNIRVWNMIEKLIDKNIDKSFVVCDLNEVVRRYESWKLAMPRIKPFYAVKCNNYPCILQLLADLGCCFDCANKFEIEAILQTNCPPERIIFASTIKDPSHVSYADSVRVTMTTFDSLSELEKCKKLYPRAELLIRIKTYSNNFSNFENKFGCDPYSEAPILLEYAKSLGLNVIGVAFHVGTACHNSTLFCNAIKLARYVFDIGQQLGFNFDVLDIGGGFIAFTETTIFEVAKYVNHALDTYFADERIKIIAEPGRYLVSSSMTIASKVISSKPKRFSCNTNDMEYVYYIDNGVTGMFQVLLHGIGISQPVAWKKNDTLYPSTVFGQTMAPTDLITSDARLPKLEIGDWVLYEDMGAYSQSMESQFHLYENTPVYFITRAITSYNIKGKQLEE